MSHRMMDAAFGFICLFVQIATNRSEVPFPALLSFVILLMRNAIEFVRLGAAKFIV
jgi:predicted histidine transporter YuiF (NhaC family)